MIKFALKRYTLRFLDYACTFRLTLKTERFQCSDSTAWRQFQAQTAVHSAALKNLVKEMEEQQSHNQLAEMEEKDTDRLKPQFGTRFLKDPKNVFQHNAWDNVVWDEEQEAEAKTTALEHTQHTVSKEKQEEYENEADMFWDKFYNQHQNRFFKDRHWLFTEFPELYHHLEDTDTNYPETSAAERGMPIGAGKEENAAANRISLSVGDEDAGKPLACSDGNAETQQQENLSRLDFKETAEEDSGNMVTEENLPQSTLTSTVELSEILSLHDCKTKITEKAESKTYFDYKGDKQDVNCKMSGLVSLHQDTFKESSTSCKFVGNSSTFRLLEVGCGVGNTVFPVLNTNKDAGLMMYCCDFSNTAVQLVKEHPDYDPMRCHAFVWDITDTMAELPFPQESLDVIIMIFVLSAVHPDKMQSAVNNLARCLKPGGLLLFRDYGRYDMAQLRFKKGRCLSENFYVRGDGTRVYFFTQEELRHMFQASGLEEKQNLIDRRLQVNRGRQLKMYRVWIQCKYRKSLGITKADNQQGTES